MNTMLGHWRIGHVMLLLCALSLWAEMAMCGSSFLSPSQRPQNRGDRKPPRVGRRAASDLDPPLNPQEITVSAPFELVLSLTRTEYEDYGAALQKMLLNVLGDLPTWVVSDGEN